MAEPLDVQRHRARDHARHRRDEDDQEKRHELVVVLPQHGQQPDRRIGLLRQHDPRHDDDDREADDVGAAQPAGVEQRVGAVMLHDDRRGEHRDRDDQRPADPRRIGPPDDPPEPEDGGEQRGRAGEQHEGQEVERLERLAPRRRRQAERGDRCEREQREPEFEQVQRPPLRHRQQVRREQPRQRRRALRDADAEHDCLQPPLRRERLHHVIEAQAAQRRARHPADRADGDGGREAVDEQMRERDQHVQDQEDHRERSQPELRAELDHQQVYADVGHDVDGRQPRDLGGI